jgi:hypothetical protein
MAKLKTALRITLMALSQIISKILKYLLSNNGLLGNG